MARVRFVLWLLFFKSDIIMSFKCVCWGPFGPLRAIKPKANDLISPKESGLPWGHLKKLALSAILRLGLRRINLAVPGELRGDRGSS